MPITKVSGKKVGNGSVGRITRKISQIYWEKHTDDSWSISIKNIKKD